MIFVRWIESILAPLVVMALLFALSTYGMLRLNLQCIEYFGQSDKNICNISWGELSIRLYMFLTFGASSVLSAYCAVRLAPSHPRALALVILLIGGSFTLYMMRLE